MKKILWGIILLVRVVNCGRDKEKSIERKKANIAKATLEQLERDYKEEFEIESIEYVEETDSYVLFVHPKSEPDISFRVTKWKMAGDNLIDNYVIVRRREQAIKYVKPYANIVNERHLIYAGIRANYEEEKDVEEREIFWDMSYKFEDIIDNYGDEVSLFIKIFYFFDVTEENKIDVYKDVYKLIEFMKEKGIGHFKVRIAFFDEEYYEDKDVEKILSKMGPTGMMRFDNEYGARQKKYRIIVEEPLKYVEEELKSYKDMWKISQFKKLTGEFWSSGTPDYEYISEEIEVIKGE